MPLPLLAKAALAGGAVLAFLHFTKKKPAAITLPAPAGPTINPFAPATPKPAAPATSTPEDQRRNPNPQTHDDVLGDPGVRIRETAQSLSPFPERNVEPDTGGILDSLAGFFGGGGVEVNVDGGVSPSFREGGGGGSSGGSSGGFEDRSEAPVERQVDVDGGISPGFREF